MIGKYTDFVERINTIYCIGRNYVEHIHELGNERPREPVVFLKPANSLLCADAEIQLPSYSDNVHYETELVLLLGEVPEQLTLSNAWQAVLAYAVGLDLTARDVQEQLKQKGLPWTKAKGFRHAACVSDFVQVTEQENIHFDLHVNGELKQRGLTEQMIFSIPELLCQLHNDYGLCCGDLVFTGTPAGVGRLQHEDELVLSLLNQITARFSVA